MTRILLIYLLPFVLPTAIYVAWVWYGRIKNKDDGELPGLRTGPFFWCLLGGFALMAGGLFTIAMVSGDPPDSGSYQSPRLEGGKIVPPHFKKK